MAIYDKIRYEKLQYNINRETAKISPLSSGKIDKYEDLTGERILPYDQSRVIEQVFIFSFRKSFWKTIKNNWRAKKKTSWSFKSFRYRKNQKLNSIEGLFLKEMRNDETKNKICEIKK